MVLENVTSDQKLGIAGFAAVLVVGVLSYFAHTPIRFLISVLGIAAVVYSMKKLSDEFDLPLAFVRRDGLNYWGGAFGGLVGGLSAFYGSTRNFEALGFLEFGVDLSLLVIFLMLAVALHTGTVLQDIKDGYIEL
ncbi:hypothetical protein [Candidatus Nanohalococcus occultus]|uniref:hypothetical protein n=1 Tax=Candidatus Nanohalococcus occultus TaxID=2978047 RepID=UPI0039E1E4B9